MLAACETVGAATLRCEMADVSTMDGERSRRVGAPWPVSPIRATMGATHDQAHVHLHLVLEDLDGVLNALLAVAGHGIEERPADADTAGAERDGLEHIARSLNSQLAQRKAADALGHHRR